MRILLLMAMIGFVGLAGGYGPGSGAAEQSTTQPAPELNLMPMPASVRAGNGALAITPAFSVAMEGYREPRLERALQRFCRELSLRTGFFVGVEVADASKATLVIHAERASKAVQELGEDESYVLEVSAAGAEITAPNPLGVMHGLQTFLQLVAVTPAGFAAPVVRIEDSPRFPWRGLTIDVSRHFIYLNTLKRNIDGMAAVKMNVLHLHLSDDQGFRVESKEFPKLQEMGSDGEFYTQAEMRELIEYARDRGIRILPEFDMPGHSTSWFVGYPELASGPGPYRIERRWGIFDPAMDPSRESTYKFLDKLIGEMAELFPDHYFHIGGDEVNGKQWDANPKIQEFMRAHKLKNDQELQQYFTLEVQKIVSKHHKEMVGWDEILAPGMPKDIVIQSWRGQESLAEAARQGYRGILSSGYYLDGMAPASQHYAVDPMANADASLTPEQQKLILGGEACMWAEFISDENIDSRIWPRTAAVAERLWSAQDVRDADSMYRRLDAVNAQLAELGLQQRSSAGVMLARMAGSDDIAALRVLADAVQPASITIREKEAEQAGGIQTSDIPLNRMVDAVAPESEAARRFSQDVVRFAAAKFQDPAAEARIRARLVLWRDNDNQLQPLLQNSFLLKELSPVSQNLTSLAATGLAALDFIDKGQTAPDSWHKQQLTMIQLVEKPTADLIFAVAPAVQQLVDASASPR
ncbi:MAG: family 20 glycosylhydrolase [Candidatus Acidiferrales bacterium]